VLDTPTAHQLVLIGPLMERVRLDLVDGRGDLVLIDQVDQPIHREVRHTDRPDSALPKEVLHRTPLAVVVAEGLVDQIEVEVVQAEALKRLLKGALGVGFAGVLDPNLGGDEQVLARDAAAPDRATDRFFV
jgi:hypothetical protein